VTVADELSKLADLLDRGRITKKDYEDLKAELVRGERPTGRSRSRPWERDELLAVLRLAAPHQEQLTVQRYTDLRTVGRVTGPTPAIFNREFGSWSAACAAAGIRSGTKLHSNYSRKWTDEELLDFVIEYVSEPRSGVTGESLTVKGIDQWLRSLRASREAPSLSTLRNRLGSWSGMRSEALSATKRRAAAKARAAVEAKKSPEARAAAKAEVAAKAKQKRLEKKWLAKVAAGADLAGGEFFGANLSGRDISGANLERANLNRADLTKANLSGALLYGADLWAADLRGADLRGADLREADLRFADFTGADLTDADLREADITLTDFTKAKVSGMNLDSFKMDDDDLEDEFSVPEDLLTDYERALEEALEQHPLETTPPWMPKVPGTEVPTSDDQLEELMGPDGREWEVE
jgi:hypothetical protein